MADRPTQPDLGLVEVTPEMEKAGVTEMREHQLGEPLGEVVTAVYMAMEYERRDASLQRDRIADKAL